MEDTRDMNLWDLCVKLAQGIFKIIKLCIRLLLEMLRIAFRWWWIVAVIMTAAVAFSLYYSRTSNLRYKVNATVYLNGPSVQEVSQAYLALNNQLPGTTYTRQNLSETLGLNEEEAGMIRRFEVFNIIDNLNNGTADYIDWKHKNSGNDTINVQMPDRLVIQFECRNLELIDKTENGIMDYLNNNRQFNDEYSVYRALKERQMFFDQLQVEKLDTLTSRMYSQAGKMQVHSNAWDLTMGKQHIDLPLEDIEDFFERKLQRDSRFMLCTAPVTLQGHFTADGRPVNGRLKTIAIAILISLLIGSLTGYIIENFKRINLFLRG